MTHARKTSKTRNPILPPRVVGWIVKHARTHYWRVAGWYELDDLIQDGLLCGYKCLAMYGVPTPAEPGEIDRPRLNEINERHFMSLVQTTFYNHMGQLIRNKRRGDDNTTKFIDLGNRSQQPRSEAQAMDRVGPSTSADQELLVWLSELPAYLQKALAVFTDENTAQEVRRLRTRLRGRDQTLTEKLRQLVGFPADLDFETELRALLWESENV
jgi:hypothetical protein